VDALRNPEKRSENRGAIGALVDPNIESHLEEIERMLPDPKTTDDFSHDSDFLLSTTWNPRPPDKLRLLKG
jgi:hypothetical protein